MPKFTRIKPRRKLKVYLAEWRQHRGLSQQALGAILGVSNMTISRWELGQAEPNLSVLAAICEALRMAPGDIYRRPSDSDEIGAILTQATPEQRKMIEEIAKTILKS